MEKISVYNLTQLEKAIEDFQNLEIHISPKVKASFLLCKPEVLNNLKEKAQKNNIIFVEDKQL